MKLVKLSIALAVCGVAFAVNAYAQQLRHPTSVQPTSLDHDYYAMLDGEGEDGTAPSPSDVDVAEPAQADVGCKTCGSKDCDCRVFPCLGWRLDRVGSLTDCMCQGDPWKAWPECNCLGIDVGGWVQLGYHTEGTNVFGTLLCNNYPNRVQAQQTWLYVERALAEDRTCCWDWGFRMDYVYGTDGQDLQAFGGQPNSWDNTWDNGGFYGHAIPQMYLEVAYEDLVITAGRFFNIGGYEVFPATGNFFYSHSFTSFLAEPRTHTGILAEWAATENITFWGGYAAGWDTGFTRNSGDIFLGGVGLQLTENVSLTYTLTAGDFGFGFPNTAPIAYGPVPGSDENAYSHSIVFEWLVTDRLTYALQSDYLDNDIMMGGVGVRDKAWGVNQYLIYEINDCLGAGVRYEYYVDDRYTIGPPPGRVNSLTFGVNVKPHPNVMLRPEVRWDDFDPGTGSPIPAVLLNDSTTFGIDMIMTF